jgi:hypothetical protein
MIWLAWRQFRAQAITAAVALFVFALALAYTGPHLLHLYHASGITACEKAHGDCGPLVDASSCPAWSECSGARRSLPANSRPAPTGSHGPRV